MRDETKRLLDLHRLPARMTPEQAAQLLGFAPHDIPVLVKASLLKPLGKPAQQAVKYFAAYELEQHAVDHEWLDAATKAVSGFWSKQNRRRQLCDPAHKGGSEHNLIREVGVAEN
jgi:hypothetical protein